MTTCAELHARLTTTPDHLDFVGPPVDIDGLSADELGDLWPLLQGAAHDPDERSPRYRLAHDVLSQVRQRRRTPRLTRAAVLATLDAVPRERWAGGLLPDLAVALADGPDPTLEDALEPLFPPPDMWVKYRYRLLRTARAVGARRLLAGLTQAVNAHFGDRLPAHEFAVMKHVPLSVLAVMAEESYYNLRPAAEPLATSSAPLLVDDPHYVVFARWALERAAAHIERIHAGELPYRADGAFDQDDGEVLKRAAQVAALRDDPWYGDVMNRLLPAICVAPGTARTAPSQTLAIALGRVVEEVPTPESVVALRRALEVVRHAGVQKKLARHQKPAERALALRPEVALRLLDAGAGVEAKRLRALLTQFFEASLARAVVLPFAEWRARLLGHDIAADFARALVWQAGSAFMLGEGDVPVDAAGQPVAVADDAPVMLWHPVEADEEERGAWRAHLAARRVRQPVRQAFREFYRLDSPDLFAGYDLGVTRLLGVARSEGWKLDGASLDRRFGDVRVSFLLSGEIYPGHDGVVGSRSFVFARGGTLVPPADVSARLASEACRAVDLLVSVAAVAEEDEDGYTVERSRRVLLLADQAGMHAMRRHALERVLAPQIAAGTVRIEGFHVHAGGAQVSMRTGRVMRDGAPLELPPPPSGKKLKAVPWLPYDEALLERVLHHVGTLLGQA